MNYSILLKMLRNVFPAMDRNGRTTFEKLEDPVKRNLIKQMIERCEIEEREMVSVLTACHEIIGMKIGLKSEREIEERIESLLKTLSYEEMKDMETSEKLKLGSKMHEPGLKLFVQHELTDQQIADLFTTAIEQSIGYWAICNEYHWIKKDENGQYLKDDHGSHQHDLIGFYALIEEGESDEDDRTFCVDRGVICSGLRNLASASLINFPKDRQLQVVANIIGDNYDETDADIVVQAGLFGEIIYG